MAPTFARSRQKSAPDPARWHLVKNADLHGRQGRLRRWRYVFCTKSLWWRGTGRTMPTLCRYRGPLPGHAGKPLATDGRRIWTANFGSDTVSMIGPW